jgi:tetratricopeptide (TPR) repeat protein
MAFLAHPEGGGIQLIARCRFLKSGQASNELLKSTACAKSALALISLIALCTCAVAQDNSADYLNNKADYWYKRGLNLTGSGSYEEALGSYDKAIQINPKYAGAWDGRASTLRSLSLSKHDANEYNESLQAYDTAIGLYDDAVKANPQDINALYYKGLALSDNEVL